LSYTRAGQGRRLPLRLAAVNPHPHGVRKPPG